MTLFKLSLRNARRQAGDYLVYFATVIISAALLYAFNGLLFSDEIRKLSSIMESLPVVITLSSIAVVCIIGWLVHYTTNFMLLRRSRELGTYILIGMEHRQVSRLFFLENLSVGGCALIPGFLLGILIFQALRAVTLALFQIPYQFSLSLCLPAAGLTFFYFLLIYLSAQIRGKKRIRKMKIFDLIYFDRQNETALFRTGKGRRKIFTGSLLLGGAGTFLLLMGNLASGIAGSACIILFLFGFFLSFSSGVPAWFEKRPEKKYKGWTLLIFRTLSAKLTTMGVVMAVISMLFTAVLITQGAGLVFAAVFENRAEQTSCFDLFIGSGKPEYTFPHYLDYIQKHIPVKDSLQYNLYQADNAEITRHISTDADMESFFQHSGDTLMRYSDYAALRLMLDYPEVKLHPGEYIVHCIPILKKPISHIAPDIPDGKETLKLNAVCTENFIQRLWGHGNGNGFVLVVPDEYAEARPVAHTVYAAMTKKPLSKEQYRALDDLLSAYCAPELSDYDTLLVKSQITEEAAAGIAITVFPLYYLALMLTITAAAILTIQQLSETGRLRQQFRLLFKLGLDPYEITKILRRQLAVYYAMPAVPPILISIPAVYRIGTAVEPWTLTGTSSPPVLTGACVLLFLLLYSVYALMAYTSLKRNVLPVTERPVL